MNVLTIDTTNQILGVAIIQQEEIRAQLTTNIKKGHSTRLMPAITQLMEKIDVKPEQLTKIVVAAGPGSYTGTRIGITTAKTLAWALQIPIYEVSSLATVAYNGILFDGYICPFFDARRKTVFTALYQWNGETLKTIKAETNIAMEQWLQKIAQLDYKTLFISPHIETFADMIKEIVGDKAVIPEKNIHLPQPANLYALSKQQDPTNVHKVAPNYLRITEAEANLKKQQKGVDTYG